MGVRNSFTIEYNVLTCYIGCVNWTYERIRDVNSEDALLKLAARKEFFLFRLGDFSIKNQAPPNQLIVDQVKNQVEHKMGSENGSETIDTIKDGCILSPSGYLAHPQKPNKPYNTSGAEKQLQCFPTNYLNRLSSNKNPLTMSAFDDFNEEDD